VPCPCPARSRGARAKRAADFCPRVRRWQIVGSFAVQSLP